MKYQSVNTGQVYNVEFKNGRQLCPECSHLRKKKSDKCLNYNSEKDVAYCHNCNTAFRPYTPYEKVKTYSVPEWKNITNLTDKAVKYFESRMIKQETLKDMKIYSDTEWMPQFEKEIEVMCFPYFLDGELRNIKYRGANKSFKLVSGAELIFWNIDCLKEFDSVIITEGEIDCLTFINNGFKNCISVPNGANVGNMPYLDEYIHLFDDIKTIYLATDHDTKGIELRDEFIRRFGAERCMLVNFKDCKDANEFYCEHGAIEFMDLLNNATNPPIQGAVYVNNIKSDIRQLFEEGIKDGLNIDERELDQYVTWETKRLAIVTGVPGSGKSEFVDYVITKLNLLYGWKSAFFTPENFPLKYHYAKIFEKLIGKKFSKENASEVEYDTAYEYINNNYFWILNEDDMTLDKILETAKYYVKKKGIKIFVIDPYNKVDHNYSSKITETQYISKFLDKLIMFGKIHDLLIFLVAHPAKMERGAIPNLYNISGSAHFYNKTDYGITVHRVPGDNNLMTNEIKVLVQKVKFKHLGSQGIANFVYNYKNGRFETGDVNHFDFTNWIERNNVEITKQEIKPDDYDFEVLDSAPF